MLRRRRSDEGFTLTELLVSMIIFGLLMAITFSILLLITYQSKDTMARTETLQQARLGLAQIDRQVRSGNVILDPAAEEEEDSGVKPFFSMRIFTQEDGEPRCAQWRVIDHDGDGFGDLQFRTWHPEYPAVLDVTAWGSVAHNLVRMDVDPPESATDIIADEPSTWPPFWVDESMGGESQAQFVRITLRLKDPSEREGAKPTSVTSVVTGRNTVFGYPTNSCADAPAP